MVSFRSAFPSRKSESFSRPDEPVISAFAAATVFAKPAAAVFANAVAAAKAEITGSSGLEKLSLFRLDKADLKEALA